MSPRPPLVFIFTVTITGILSNTLVTPAIPDILDELGVAPDRAGILVATGSMAGIVVAPVAGLLADRFGRRIVLTTSLVVFGGFGGLAALSPTFNLLLVARFLQGVGSAGLINLAVVLIGDNWSGAERTKLIGRNSAVLTVGLAALPLISGAVTETAGWRVAFGLYTAALGTAAAAWMVLDGWRPAHPPPIRQQVVEASRVVRQPTVSIPMIGGFLGFVIIFGLFLTVLPIHLADRFGMEAGARGVMIGLPAVTSTLVAFNLGRIRRVLGVRAVLIASAIGFVAAYLLLGLAPAVAILAVGTLVYGAAEGLLIPSLQDLAMEVSPDAHRAAVMAAWVSVVRIGQTVGPILTGYALTVWTTGTTLLTGAALGGVILVLGLLAPLSRGRTQPASRVTR